MSDLILFVKLRGFLFEQRNKSQTSFTVFMQFQLVRSFILEDPLINQGKLSISAQGTDWVVIFCQWGDVQQNRSIMQNLLSAFWSSYNVHFSMKDEKELTILEDKQRKIPWYFQILFPLNSTFLKRWFAQMQGNQMVKKKYVIYNIFQAVLIKVTQTKCEKGVLSFGK